MNCAQVRETLPLYHEDELDPTLAERVARHLEACVECRSLAELDRALDASLARLAPRWSDRPIDARRARIWAGIQRRYHRRGPTPLRLGRAALQALALGATIVLILMLVAVGKATLDARATSPDRSTAMSHLVADLRGIAMRLGLAPRPGVAFTFVAGHVARVDPITGAVLARSADVLMDQFPSLAASRDGREVFVLHSEPGDGGVSDQLLTLSATSLALEAKAPVQHFMRPMESWPPALAVTPDDRTVIVSQYGWRDTDPYWISYYDRQTGRFAVDSTVLSGCGVSQLLPFDDRVAVLCLGSDDLRFVDLHTHRVTATVTPGVTPAGVLGSAVAAGLIPDQRALAVVLDRGELVRVDPDTRAISVIADLLPSGGDLRVRCADFSANGRVAVALVRADGSETRPVPVVIADVANGRILDRLSVDSLYLALTLSPDGQRLYVAAASGALQSVDLTSHVVSPFGPDPAQTGVHLVFAAG